MLLQVTSMAALYSSSPKARKRFKIASGGTNLILALAARASRYSRNVRATVEKLRSMIAF